jgi:SAM-dependent methyltransferase
MNVQEVTKTRLESSRLPPATPMQLATMGLAGMILSPFYWGLAYLKGVPGLALRWKCFKLGLHLLIKRVAPIDLKAVFFVLLYPLDSTRYFEFDFVWRVVGGLTDEKHLDVSSPRLFFTLLLLHNPRLNSELINPDQADLAETQTLIQASGLGSRCRLHGCVIAEAPFSPASFDLITSMSVVEHIPEDRLAIQRMWNLLKPGGRLILTVPCAARTSEQYIDRDEYGVLGPDADGLVFWQRFYDEALLQERIFSVTGPPRYQQIFGERVAGQFLKMAARKRTDRYYPFWREPYMVGQDYTYFNSLNDLPGEGVIAMEFVKS